MTYPWAAGEVLTAADLNAAIGLVPVKTQAITGTPSSVSVTDVFSAQFVNYRILLDQMDVSSGPASVTFQFTGATTTYYGSYSYDFYTGGATGVARTNNGSALTISTVSTSEDSSSCFDCFSPFATTKSRISGTGFGAGYMEWFGGTQFSNTSFTGFTISVSGITFTGGTIRVYGYNNG